MPRTTVSKRVKWYMKRVAKLSPQIDPTKSLLLYTESEVAEVFNIGPRTVRRDMLLLNNLDIPVVNFKGAFYSRIHPTPSITYVNYDGHVVTRDGVALVGDVWVVEHRRGACIQSREVPKGDLISVVYS